MSYSHIDIHVSIILFRYILWSDTSDVIFSYLGTSNLEVPKLD